MSSSNAISTFELIHCDVWGPYSIKSSCGASYFLTIVDDYSRGVWVYLMGAKSEVGKIIEIFFAMASTQFNKKVKRVCSDNGTEFTCLRKFFEKQGTLYESSCVGTPQQNGRVERKHRHILNVAQALRFQAHLPFEFWGECILTAGYLINRTPTPFNKGKTPYELLFGHSLSYNHFRTFGCLSFVSKIPRDKNKFNSRSRKCIFVGYPHGQKGWRLYDLDNGDIFFSRDVTFYENNFPLTQSQTSTTLPGPPLSYPTTVDYDFMRNSHVGDGVPASPEFVDIDTPQPDTSPPSNNA